MDNDHLLLHLKEKYIMKSLIIIALKYKDYLYPDCIYEYELNNKNNRKQIIISLKKYFKDKLIKK